MISIPLVMIASVTGFFGLMAAIAGAGGRKPRGAHRA
jgi:hypothetical protein